MGGPALDMAAIRFPWGAAEAWVLLHGRRPVALEIDKPDMPVLDGALARARVLGAHPGTRGWRLQLPDGHEAVLPHARSLQAGDMLPVAVTADARGAKPATVTDKPSFPGTLLVHLPLESGLHLSRQARALAGSAERREALKPALAALGEGGWILRHGAIETPVAEVLAEAGALVAAAAVLAQAGPIAWLQPPKTALQRLALDPAVPLLEAEALERLDLHAALTALLQPQVPFGEGGRLIVEATEALWAVDVDGGRERSPVRLVDLALEALVPQLRLRHIGGAIVVDLPRLDDKALQKRAVQRLEALAAAQLPDLQVLGFTRGGLLELVRPHGRPSLLALGLPPLI